MNDIENKTDEFDYDSAFSINSGEELREVIDNCDVYVSEADDLAYSLYSMILAQKRERFAISFMPSGITGYVIVLHPELNHLIDPTDLFGSPKNMSYRQLSYFLHNPLNRCGRR